MSVARRPNGANAFATLAYADIHALVNAVRTVRRHAGRTLLWLGYVLVVLGFAALKLAGPHASAPRTQPFWQIAIDDFWVCGLTIAFGAVLATGSSRWLGIFTSRAEPLFLTRARLAPAMVATYLQVRAVVLALGQTALRFAYLILVGLPGGTTVSALLAELCFFAACGAAIASVALPRALARGPILVAATVAGWAIVAVAAFPLVADALHVVESPSTAAMRRALPAWHPGTVLAMLNATDLRVAAFPLIVAVLASAAFIAVARDAYPELYAISLANLEWRSKRHARRNASNDAGDAAVTHAASRTAIRWRGALVFVWSDWLAFSRRVPRPLAILVAALVFTAGAGLAVLASGVENSLLLGILLGIVPMIYLGIAPTLGLRLASAMRLPLFWLGDVTLAARLSAWAFGALWRDLALLVIASCGYLLVNRDPMLPGTGLLGGIGLLALTRAVGLAVFALVPNALDQRGPAVMLRVAASMALLIPAVLTGLIVGLLTESLVASVAGGTLAALAESALLVLFAAWRLAGRVDMLSTA
ncbi:MAG: hypothetical protein ABI186_06470 [Candidatus Elarobacter sp.]